MACFLFGYASFPQLILRIKISPVLPIENQPIALISHAWMEENGCALLGEYRHETPT
ncbi:uncharacterized protein METZ01_LOCUS446353, partial [marine metagenome]